MNNLYLTSFSNVAYLVLFGVAPSIVWLWYFLRKDDNPEPKKMILKVFVFGFFSTFVAFTLEWALIKAVTDWKLACLHCESAIPYFPQTWGATWAALLFSFAVLASLAFIEEWVKYIAAKAQIIRSAYFDEPVDAMIYLIVAALGFAAAENIGYVFQNADWAVAIAYFRFLSSTFLHVLASAIIGYFFALSLIWRRNHLPYLAVGVVLATALHAVFNFLIITSDGEHSKVSSLALLMIGSFAFVSYLFSRVKKLTFQNATIPSSHAQ